MATNQVGNEMPPDEHQPALPALDLIQGFRPLVPTEEMESASQRLQHIYVTNGSPASFGLVVSKQWRADRANGRTTWAVVGTALEAELFEQDLVSGAASDVPGESIDAQLVANPSQRQAITGHGIVIVTFERLVTFLSGCFQEDRTWQWDASCGSPTVVMNFGWGNMSFEMAFACPLLARFIVDTMQEGPQVVMACTVSSDDRLYFGRSWCEVEMQEVTVLTRGLRTMPKFFRSEDSGLRTAPKLFRSEDRGDNSVESFQEITPLLSEISNNSGREEGSRTLLLLDERQLFHALEDWGPKPLYADQMERLRGNDTGNIALSSTTSYIGQVSRISDVIIYPYLDAFTIDKGQICHSAWLYAITRSQAEINYHSRCNQESGSQPQVHIVGREEYIRLLPAHCESSDAHTLHLARLLVCCKFIWPEVPLVDIPVLLPEDQNIVVQQLKHLYAKRIMGQGRDSLPLQADRERSPELDGGMTLTPLGRITGAILMKGVRSLHSAHLLAQLVDTTAEYGALNKTSGGVVEAVLAFAVLTEVYIQDILSKESFFSVKDWVTPHHKAWYDMLVGISEGKTGRGPMWLAAGLWEMLTNDDALRGLRTHVRATGRHDQAEVQLNEGSIVVNVGLTLLWDLRLAHLSRICSLLSDMDRVDELEGTPLTDKESLTVEVALVRAFMDRIMLVEYHEDDQAREDRAWDLASGHRLGQPVGSQKFQIWWKDCHSRDELESGERSPVIFCVYNFMIYDPVVSGHGFTGIRRPVDATYVSARAVRLAFQGTDDYSRVNDPMSYIQLLKGRDN